MIIRKYGISLVRLKKEHIELVRQKRNLAYIQDKMLYKKKINWFQQRRWFKQINNPNNLYLLIEYNNQFIGLINGKDIDFEKRTCEGGIFIWEKKYWETYIPVAASIILNDFNFFMANFKINYAKVLKSNRNAVQYNLIQGYRIVEEDPNGVVMMSLNKEDYVIKSAKLKKAIGSITKDNNPLSVNNFSFEDDDIKTMKLLYSELPQDIQQLVYNQMKQKQ